VKWKIKEKKTFPKYLLLIAIIIGVLVFLISYFFTDFKSSLVKTPEPSEELKNCMKLSTGAQQEDCITNISIIYKNSSFCTYAPGSYKNTCYGRVAVRLKDITICDEMIPKGEPTPARNTCYADAAIASDDKNLCEKVKAFDIDKYNYCLRIFEKIEACKKLENDYKQKICLAGIFGD
jgi:hypothetical protein